MGVRMMLCIDSSTRKASSLDFASFINFMKCNHDCNMINSFCFFLKN